METLGEIRTAMKDDLGLGRKDWMDNEELNGYIRRAVRIAHAEILSMYEDYFLQMETVDLPASSNMLPYPSNCYANKIRTIVFTNAPIGSKGTYATKIKSFRDITKETEYDMLLDNPASCPIRHWIPYSTTEVLDGVTRPVKYMKLVPFAIDDNGHVIMWYIRKAITLINDNDICDIPEFVDYVLAIAKQLYYEQDGDQNYEIATIRVRNEKALMTRVLANMKLDENNELQQDSEFYSQSIA